MTFERTNKYLVLKWDDIKRLPEEGKEELLRPVSQIDANRAREGKPAYNRYIVVNEDEPYAEEVWDLIEQHEALQRIRPKIQADPELSDFWEKFCYYIT